MSPYYKVSFYYDGEYCIGEELLDECKYPFCRVRIETGKNMGKNITIPSKEKKYVYMPNTEDSVCKDENYIDETVSKDRSRVLNLHNVDHLNHEEIKKIYDYTVKKMEQEIKSYLNEGYTLKVYTSIMRGDSVSITDLYFFIFAMYDNNN